jgi:hypothetical protein
MNAEGEIELYSILRDHASSKYPFHVIENLYRALSNNDVAGISDLVTEETIAATSVITENAKWLTKIRELTFAAISSGDPELAARLVVEKNPATGEDLLELVERYRDIKKPLHDGVL